MVRTLLSLFSVGGGILLYSGTIGGVCQRRYGIFLDAFFICDSQSK